MVHFPRLRAESPDLLHLDMLRLLASFGIVAVHFRQNLLAFLPDPGPAAVAIDSLSLGVDLFFLISGFVISWVYSSKLTTVDLYRKFVWKRLARLVPLHWATLLFFVTIGVLAAALGTELDRAAKYNWSCLPSNALLLHAWYTCDTPSFNTVSWSISAELTMYLIYPLLFAFVSRRPIVAAAGLAIVIAVLFAMPADTPWTERTYQFGVLRAFPAFLLGVLLFHYRAQLERVPCPRLLLAATGIAFVAGIALSVPRGSLLPLAYLIGAFGIASDMRGRVSKAVAWLAPGGRLTYSAYMLHPIVQSLMIVLVGKKLLHLSGWWLTGWTCLAFGVVAGVGYLSLIFFEEPARRRLSPRRFVPKPKPPMVEAPQ